MFNEFNSSDLEWVRLWILKNLDLMGFEFRPTHPIRSMTNITPSLSETKEQILFTISTSQWRVLNNPIWWWPLRIIKKRFGIYKEDQQKPMNLAKPKFKNQKAQSIVKFSTAYSNAAVSSPDQILRLSSWQAPEHQEMRYMMHEEILLQLPQNVCP